MARFDLRKTQELGELFKTDHDARDDAWVGRFYDAVVDASLATREEQVTRGPDGFPYFALYMPPEGQGFDAFCVSHVLGVCTDDGFGIVINPDKGRPDWVFSYGNLWSLRAYGSFDAGVTEPTSRDEPVQPPAGAGQVLVAAPNEQYFPPYARTVLKSYLEHHGVKEPRVMLIDDVTKMPPRSLAFSVFQEDFETPQAFGDFMTRLTWFLPPHYGLVSVPKDSDIAGHFVTF